MEYRPITEEELVGVAPKGWQADDEIERFILGAHRMPITGELRAAVGADFTLVMGDVNGDGAADFHIELRGAYSLATGDFVL